MIDDASAGGGSIKGWKLRITTALVDMLVPGTASFGPADPYPATRTQQGETGVITDLDVTVPGLSHDAPMIWTSCSPARRDRRSR